MPECLEVRPDPAGRCRHNAPKSGTPRGHGCLSGGVMPCSGAEPRDVVSALLRDEIVQTCRIGNRLRFTRSVQDSIHVDLPVPRKQCDTSQFEGTLDSLTCSGPQGPRQ